MDPGLAKGDNADVKDNDSIEKEAEKEAKEVPNMPKADDNVPKEGDSVRITILTSSSESSLSETSVEDDSIEMVQFKMDTSLPIKGTLSDCVTSEGSLALSEDINYDSETVQEPTKIDIDSLKKPTETGQYVLVGDSNFYEPLKVTADPTSSKKQMEDVDSSDSSSILTDDVMLLTSEASQLFIKMLLKDSYEDAKGTALIEYKNVEHAINSIDRYTFLRELIAKQMSLEECAKFIMSLDLARENESKEEIDSEIKPEDNDKLKEPPKEQMNFNKQPEKITESKDQLEQLAEQEIACEKLTEYKAKSKKRKLKEPFIEKTEDEIEEEKIFEAIHSSFCEKSIEPTNSEIFEQDKEFSDSDSEIEEELNLRALFSCQRDASGENSE